MNYLKSESRSSLDHSNVDEIDGDPGHFVFDFLGGGANGSQTVRFAEIGRRVGTRRLGRSVMTRRLTLGPTQLVLIVQRQMDERFDSGDDLFQLR